MSCPKTQYLLSEYFSDDLSLITRGEFEKHIQTCSDCATELTALQGAQNELAHWQDERVPHWDRGTTLFRTEHGGSQQQRGWLWQWLPTTVSFAMLCLVVFNVTVSSSDSGFTVLFGNSEDPFDTSRFEQRVAQLAEIQQMEQDQTLQAFLFRLDERQDSNNLRLMQAVMDQTQQMTAENFDQMYSYFEQQRQLDLENVQVSYQQLVDSDFDTMRSMQQLANFVQYTGETR